jgi:hypothetical protein
MKNSASDHGLFIESDDDEEKDLGRDENDGNESDFSNDSHDNLDQRKPSSYSMAWPQSYRSATSVQIQFFLFFCELLFFVMKQLQLVFFMYSYIFIQ